MFLNVIAKTSTIFSSAVQMLILQVFFEWYSDYRRWLYYLFIIEVIINLFIIIKVIILLKLISGCVFNIKYKKESLKYITYFNINWSIWEVLSISVWWYSGNMFSFPKGVIGNLKILNPLQSNLNPAKMIIISQ